MGREVTCGVLDAAGARSRRARFLPTEMRRQARRVLRLQIALRTRAEPTTVPRRSSLPGVTANVQAAALAAHRALGCRDLSRADFVVGDGADPAAVTLLEVNTLPGNDPDQPLPRSRRGDRRHLDGAPVRHGSFARRTHAARAGCLGRSRCRRNAREYVPRARTSAS